MGSQAPSPPRCLTSPFSSSAGISTAPDARGCLCPQHQLPDQSRCHCPQQPQHPSLSLAPTLQQVPNKPLCAASRRPGLACSFQEPGAAPETPASRGEQLGTSGGGVGHAGGAGRGHLCPCGPDPLPGRGPESQRLPPSARPADPGLAWPPFAGGGEPRSPPPWAPAASVSPSGDVAGVLILGRAEAPCNSSQPRGSNHWAPLHPWDPTPPNHFNPLTPPPTRCPGSQRPCSNHQAPLSPRSWEGAQTSSSSPLPTARGESPPPPRVTSDARRRARPGPGSGPTLGAAILAGLGAAILFPLPRRRPVSAERGARPGRRRQHVRDLRSGSAGRAVTVRGRSCGGLGCVGVQ